jgi:hypothetical protein
MSWTGIEIGQAKCKATLETPLRHGFKRSHKEMSAIHLRHINRHNQAIFSTLEYYLEFS